jgi:LmbE family N-acetylglucosaminyl deacetylase
MNRVLVIAAHPDDEVLGVGATIARHVANGDIAECLILGEGQTSRFHTRESADKDLVEQLHEDTLLSAKEIGYQKVHFADFPDNRFDHVDLLDIIKTVEDRINVFKPNIIYTHYIGDLNIDHEITFRVVITATRPVNQYFVKEIYAFETLSSTEWNFSNEIRGFRPNIFIDVEDYFEKKVQAFKHYKSELNEFPHPRSIKALEYQALKWGSVVGKKYVEAFELIRKVK